jgi:hypothetical protein
VTYTIQSIELSFPDAKDLIQKCTTEIGNQFMRNLIGDVDKTLYSSYNDYVSALSVDNKDSQYDIQLDGALANAIENGGESFDMKPGFQASDKVKFSNKGAWYLTVVLGGNTKQAQINPSVMRFLRTFNRNSTRPVKFVRVGQSTNANKWIHPGITARRFFNQANDDLDIDAIIKKTMKDAGFN